MRILFYLAPFGAALCLASCGEVGTEAAAPADESEFGRADKAAARALSIGNTGTADGPVTPYEQAIKCRAAIGALNVFFEESGTLDPEQAQTIQQVVVHYRKEVAALVRNAEKSAAEIEADLREAEEEIELAGARETIAVACLRRLDERTGR